MNPPVSAPRPNLNPGPNRPAKRGPDLALLPLALVSGVVAILSHHNDRINPAILVIGLASMASYGGASMAMLRLDYPWLPPVLALAVAALLWDFMDTRNATFHLAAIVASATFFTAYLAVLITRTLDRRNRP